MAGSGLAAARALHVNQSTISRHVKAVLPDMELVLERRSPFCRLHGDLDLLQAERGVHQLARLKGRAPLRIDGHMVSGARALGSLPPGWILGPFDQPGMERPLELLEQPVIDAWVGSDSQSDLPEADHPSWCVIDLLRRPVPRLGAPGLWGKPATLRRDEPRRSDGPVAKVLTLGGRLEGALGPISGDTLIVRRELMEHAPIQLLARVLRHQDRRIVGCFEDVVVG